MFTDTHCHMSAVRERGYDMKKLIEEIQAEKVPFILDIGTKPKDLQTHMDFINSLCVEYSTEELKDIFYFSAGIWPGVDDIVNRTVRMQQLEESLISCKNKAKVVAIGECGLDRHWNKADENGKTDGYDTIDVQTGEVELFEMQIELARKYDLPVIVHSRDAAIETYEIIKKSGYTKGVIHCYSYGIDELQMFLDLGWYISLSGSITYAKKAQMDATYALVRAIPRDKLLLETDAPYLTPVPKRGKTNTPIRVKHVYEFVSEILGISNEELAEIVLENTKCLFLN